MALLSCTLPRSLYFQRFLRTSWSLAIKTRSSSTAEMPSVNREVLPFSEIPGPKGTIRNCLDYALSKAKGSHFDLISKRFERFGPIYSEQVLDTRIVSISDLDAIKKALGSGEQTFQMRPGLEAVAEIVENDNGLGLASNDYEIWWPERSLISPKMLRPKDISETFPMLNSVANDVVERLSLVTQSADDTINNIEEELSSWSVESFASFVFNHRLGLYDQPVDLKAVAFRDVSLYMIYHVGKLFYTFPLNKYIKTPSYYRSKKALAAIHALGIEILDEILATKQEREEDSSQRQSVFEYLFANGVNTPKSMAAITGLMAAGVDTTSTTCLWLLYDLSRNPECQEKLYRELVSALGPEEEISANNIPPLLKAALKESLRMNPVAGYVVARVFDNDLQVLGYNIPAGVNVLMYEHLLSLDERYYGEDAKQFVPERWLRDQEGKKREMSSFTSLPFGYGVRMCVGRRMAESMIYTLVSKILLSYRLEYAGETEVKWSLVGGLMKPDRSILLKFIPRGKNMV